MSRFEVSSILGQGGGGVVYRGWDHQRGCPVAIKTLAEPYSPDDAARFAREAEALVVLRHPHVVRTLASLPGPPPQLIMELLPDGSLEDRLRAEGAQPIPRVVRWGQLLADTLAFVHARGFVHRDLKPANVLLDGDQLKLADFGLTRGDAAHTITHTGEVLGTPAYLAPEQALGQPVGPQTDVYGLGALLYALLGGQPPAGGASALETLHRVANGELTPLRKRRPDVPPWLERVVARCLATDPRERYASMAEVAQALAAGEAPRPRRRGLVAGFAAASLLTAGFAGVLALRGRSPATASSSPSEAGPVEAATGDAPAGASASVNPDDPVPDEASPAPALQDHQAELRAELDGAGALPRAELQALLREVATSDPPPEPSLWPQLAELYVQADLPEVGDAYLHHALPRFPKYQALRDLAQRRGYDRAANRLEVPPDLTPVWRAHLADPAPPNPASLFDEALLPRERLLELKRLALSGEFHLVEREVLRAFPEHETRYEEAARAANVLEALELDHWARFLLLPWGARDPRAALRLSRTARSSQEREALLAPWRDALDPLDLRLLAATEASAGAGSRLEAELAGAQLSPDQRAELCHLRLPRRRGERDAAAEAEAQALLREPLSLRSRVDLWGGLSAARFVRGDWVGALEAARGWLELKPWHGGMQLQVGLSLWAMKDDPSALRVLLPLARSPWRQPLITGSAAEEVVKLVDSGAALVSPLDASAWDLLLQRARERNALRRDASSMLPYLQRLLRQAQKVGAWSSLVDLATAGAEAYPQHRAEFTHLASLGLRRGQGDAAAERFLEALEPGRREELEAWIEAQPPR